MSDLHAYFSDHTGIYWIIYIFTRLNNQGITYIIKQKDCELDIRNCK